MAKSTLTALMEEGDMDLSSLSPDQKVILQVVGRALAELHDTFEQAHIDNMRVLESIQQMQTSHAGLLDNLPRDLTKPTATDEWHTLKNKVTVMWKVSVRLLFVLSASVLGALSFIASEIWGKLVP